jgi:hypothetical protein
MQEQFKGSLPVLDNIFPEWPLVEPTTGDSQVILPCCIAGKSRSIFAQHTWPYTCLCFLWQESMDCPVIQVRRDIILGTPTRQEHRIWKKRIELYLNTLTIHVRQSPKESFLDLAAVQKEVLSAYEHQVIHLMNL